MKCAEARRYLSSLVQGELDLSRRREVEAHVHDCLECQTVVAQYAELARLARSLPAPAAPPEFEQAFERAVMQQTSARPAPESGTPLRSTSIRARPRFAIAGMGIVAIAAVLAAFFYFRGTRVHDDHQVQLESFLHTPDFGGLARAMDDGDRRARLLHDSVSVDLLIDALGRLQRSHERHGQAGRYLARYVALFPHKEIELLLVSTGGLRAGTGWSSTSAGFHEGSFDFKKALRALRAINRPGVRVTLNELIDTWARRHKE